MRALVLSDGRKGHESQSVAFCKLKEFEFEICKISYKNKFLKILSYILDFLNFKFKIFECEDFKFDNFDIFVGAGSTTYYGVKFLAKKYNKKSVALMYPKGFKKDFDLIVSSLHDSDMVTKNCINLPVNLNLSMQNGFYKPQKKAIGFVIGGENSIFKMDNEIVNLVDNIKAKFTNFEFLLTTSPRTPNDIENKFENSNFDFKVIYSKNQINPIGDFLAWCEWVFITQDSVSMISEAVCNGVANVVILPLLHKTDKKSKFDKFINLLKKDENLQIYSQDCEFKRTKKINLKNILMEVKI